MALLKSNLPPLMTNDSPADILARLEAGFRANSAELQTVEKELRLSVQRGRAFGEKHGAGAVFNPKWDGIDAILNGIQRLATEIDQAPQGRHEQSDIENGLESWKALQSESEHLTAALRDFRTQAAALDAAARTEWNELAKGFEEEQEALHACARAMRIRLELLDGRSQEEVDEFVRHVLAELRDRPMPEEVDASIYQLEYLKAAIETAHEKHESLGFPRIIKTLFTWYENPEERVRRELFLPID